ncbi:hypothetical protein ACIRRA_08195 [Nocardia sp. NPDC101769]|uniref:hypothetical protein n=2 Tax=unclassified Nocardia TaxID=2637762 RepID=UPI0038292F5B
MRARRAGTAMTGPAPAQAGPDPIPTGYDRFVHRMLWLLLDARTAQLRHKTAQLHTKISRPGVYRGRPPAAMNAAAQRFRAPRA